MAGNSENVADAFSKTLDVSRATALKIIGLKCRGGIAEIYNAFDIAGSQVIVRKLRPEHKFNLTLRRRFLVGVKVRRKLGRHPNIVQYYAQQGGMQPYEIIEYVPGETLKNLIVNRHRLIREQPFSILRQAGEALQHIHHRGFLHLDIKPENYLVAFVGDGGIAKLTDFDFSLPIATKRVSRKFGGSMLYEPPEFLSHKDVSVATDVFAFGVLAYYLFTYQMPFVESSHDMLKGGAGQVSFTTGNEGRVTPPVQDFIRRCLHPRPEYRYGSGASLIKAIDKMAIEHLEYQQKHGLRKER